MLFFVTAVLHAQAQLAPAPYFNFEGKLTNSSGQPITDSAAVFTISITDPSAAGDCVIYQERQTVNLSATDGAFNILIGGPSSVRTSDDHGVVFTDVFDNNVSYSDPDVCPGGYTPASGDARNLKVTVTAGGVTESLPLVTIGSSPTATVASSAQTLQGRSPVDFLQVNESGSTELSQTNLEEVFSSTNRPKLMDLIDGTSTQFLTSTSLTNLADPTAAQHAATKNYCDMNIGGKQVDSTSLSTDIGAGVGDGMVLTWDAAGNKWTAEVPAVDSLGNHTATADLDMANNKIMNLADPTAAQDAATKNYADTKFITKDLPAVPSGGQDGQSIRYNNGSGAWEYYTPISTGADNLGDHTATQNIVLSPNWLSGDGDPEGIFVETDGRVGVGTASPATRLTNSVSIVTDSLGFGPSPEGLQWKTNSFGNVAGFSNMAVVGGANGVSVTTADSSASSYIFHATSNNSSRMIVRSDGKVGINTSSPSSELHVEGTVRAQQICDETGTTCQDLSTVPGSDRVSKAGDTMTGSLNMSGNRISSLGDPSLIQDAATKNYVDNGLNSKVGGSGNVGTIPKFNTTTELTNSNISDDGSNVSIATGVAFGVGAATPQSLIHAHDGSGGVADLRLTNSVTGPTLSDGFSIAVDGGASAYLINHENTDLHIGTTSTPQMTFKNDGRIGIGTANPNVANKVHISSPTTYPLRVQTDDTVGGLELFRASGSGGSRLTVGVFGGNQSLVMDAGADGVNDLSVSSVGKVGIGTTTPSSQLHIELPAGTTGGMMIKSNAVGTPQILLDGTSISGGKLWTINGNSGGGGGENDNLRFINATNSTSVMELDGNTGSVGIGTAAPTSKLQVNGSIQAGSGSTSDIKLGGTGATPFRRVVSVPSVPTTGAGSFSLPTTISPGVTADGTGLPLPAELGSLNFGDTIMSSPLNVPPAGLQWSCYFNGTTVVLRASCVLGTGCSVSGMNWRITAIMW